MCLSVQPAGVCGRVLVCSMQYARAGLGPLEQPPTALPAIYRTTVVYSSHAATDAAGTAPGHVTSSTSAAVSDNLVVPAVLRLLVSVRVCVCVCVSVWVGGRLQPHYSQLVVHTTTILATAPSRRTVMSVSDACVFHRRRRQRL